MSTDEDFPSCQQGTLLQFNLDLLSIEVDIIEFVLGQVNYLAHTKYGRG
ncbi:hypothetical protein [Coleofasciculus chthonoplastes]